MIPLPQAEGQSYAVVGLGKSGTAAAAALRASGAKVRVWDDAEASRRRALDAGYRISDPRQDDYSDLKAAILAPGIPLTHPQPHAAVATAARAGVPVIGDIELLWQARRAALYVGITGTNGKSTTTALLGHLLRQAGLTCEVGGNLGTPVLTFQPLGAGQVYVLEVSSYQLDLLQQTAFDVAVLLNITPDHLDRHGSMAGYVEAKKRVFRNQSPTQVAIVGLDDAPCQQIAAALQRQGRRVWPISTEGPAAGGLYVENDRLIDATDGPATARLDLGGLERLPGRHNWQNVLAAYGAARALGVAPESIAAALRSFAGLAHRQEYLGTKDGVRFVNDSKATNAEAAAKALACYDRIYWILGGQPKAGGIDGLEPFYPRIAEAFLIGEASEAFAGRLGDRVKHRRCGDLATATAAAFAAAREDGRPGAVVLLSPACASFDQFPNFEVRGEAFRHAVAAIVQGEAR